MENLNKTNLVTFKLSKRLVVCAKFVPEGSLFADIGTDHAYLPIWLIKNNIVKKAIACDINAEPLLSAKNNAVKHKTEIKTLISDGFSALTKEDFDCANIAGMGGDLIVKILENCDFIKEKTLVLQPMSKAYKLREYLCKNGFVILKEEAVLDKGKIYSVMFVKHKELLCSADIKGINAKIFYYMGALKPEDSLSKNYALSVLKDLENSLKSGIDTDLTQSKIDEIKRMYL